METSIANQNFSSDDPLWILLVELSLSDFLDRPGAGYLFKKLRELGMPPASLENIARALAGSAKEALTRSKQERLELPGRIRIFCQKKILEEANSVRPSRGYHTEPDKKQKETFPDVGAKTIGGWGYFIIERGEDLPPDSSVSPHHDVDLYLYKEGE
jgi:hypothetical protein